MATKLIALLWGFAEGTLFFFVPDVYLGAVGLVDRRRAFSACFYALAGSLLGGTLMYYWGTVNAPGALRVLDAVPAISPVMIETVRAQLVEYGALGVFAGPIGGVPYKIYAVQASGAGVGLVAFLLISIPARVIRFIAVAMIAPPVVRKLGRQKTLRWNIALLLCAWSVFYAFYFIIRAE